MQGQRYPHLIGCTLRNGTALSMIYCHWTPETISLMVIGYREDIQYRAYCRNMSVGYQ